MQKKVWIALVLVVLFATASFFYYKMFNFDAEGYVEALLDSNLKHESEKLLNFDRLSEGEIESMNNEILNYYIGEYVDQDKILSDELEKKYEELFASILERAKYRVIESEKRELRLYAVKVNVEPIELKEDFYVYFMEEIDSLEDELNEAVRNGLIYTQEEYTEKFYEKQYEVLAEYVETLSYKDTIELELFLYKNKRGDFEIVESDYQICLDLLIE